MNFTNQQLERYSRHIILKEIGVKGQKRLCAGSVLVVGATGPAVPAVMYLAAAGVGKIGICDTSNEGAAFAESAAESARALNPDIEVKAFGTSPEGEAFERLLSGYDFAVIAGSGTGEQTLLINDICLSLGKPFVAASAAATAASAAGDAATAKNDAAAVTEVDAAKGGSLWRIMTVIPGKSPCLRCANTFLRNSGAPEFCSESREVTDTKAAWEGASDGIVGSVEAAEAVKFIAGAGTLICGRALCFDPAGTEYSVIDLAAACCGTDRCGFRPEI
ncbi:MAG: ThiF family adenylyltransferase [Clostridia bacterium]|nr:ThiF family adenylyltransferase [Clostridia bacterium]